MTVNDANTCSPVSRLRVSPRLNDTFHPAFPDLTNHGPNKPAAGFILGKNRDPIQFLFRFFRFDEKLREKT